MLVNIGKHKYKLRAMDIETHNDDESIAKKETSMWLGAYIDEFSTEDDESIYFYSMSEFFEKLKKDTRPERNANKTRTCKNVVCEIYNLSFEWSFILPELLKAGFRFAEKFDYNDEYVYNSVTTKTCSSVWVVQLKFGKDHGIVILRDLAKMFTGGLRNVAKSFNLPTQKGEIDYRLNRLHGHQVTKEEKSYVFKDVRILMDILIEMYRRNDKDFFASASMASYSMRKLLKRGFSRTFKAYAQFREYYPELDANETDFLRRGVEGGITYPPPRYQFKNINTPIAHCDAHSMHPSSAYLNRFPYGCGEYFIGKPPLGYICACRIKISYDGVLLHSIIKLIGYPFITDKEIVVWDFEIPTMKKCYINLHIEYIDGYAYKAKMLPWRGYYADCYNKRILAKKNGDEFNKLYYKLLINSSYGKLLERPHNEIFENIIDEDGLINSKVHARLNPDVNSKYTYLPVGSAIPAYSRVSLIEHALKLGWENICYFDTDSIFFIWNDKTREIWEKEFNHDDFLGGWDMEEIVDKAQFAAPKRYKTEKQGVTIVKAGGINFSEYLNSLKEKGQSPKLEYNEVNILSSTWKVQRAYRVKGGTIIEFQIKKMKILDKYQKIYEENV